MKINKSTAIDGTAPKMIQGDLLPPNITVEDIEAIWKDLEPQFPKSDWWYVTYDGCPRTPYRDKGREMFLRNNING